MKYIDFVFNCPPSADAPQFIEIRSDDDQVFEVGSWLAPDADSPFWRLRVPVELVPRMVVPDVGPQPILTAAEYSKAVETSTAADQRRRLKQKVDGVKAKMKEQQRQQAQAQQTQQQQTAAQPAKQQQQQPSAAGYDKCPACHQAFNVREFQLLDCKDCGDTKCSAICIPDPDSPCLDCQALAADPEEGGYDPTAVPYPPRTAEAEEAAKALGSRLFDGIIHGKDGSSSADSDGGEDDIDADDSEIS